MCIIQDKSVLLSFYLVWENQQMYRHHKILLFCSLLLSPLAELAADQEEELIFFDVGQGHASLIAKGGTNEETGLPHTPLLIDAGSTAYPLRPSKSYKWERKSRDQLIDKIGQAILGVWEKAYEGGLRDKVLDINIIVTHPDADHIGFVSSVLSFLVGKASLVNSTVSSHLLLGGSASLYSERPEANELTFSSDYLGLNNGPEFLNASNCISHLFCPQGLGDANGWSIISRVELESISAVIAGDADATVKTAMLEAQGPPYDSLRADVLLVSHHGAAGTFQSVWNQTVDPQALVFASGTRYGHPRTKTLNAHLEMCEGSARIWANMVSPHGVQFYGTTDEHIVTDAHFARKGSHMIDPVPLQTGDQAESSSVWRVFWTNLPIYCLWNSGTVTFSEDVNHPTFVDAPYGLLPSTAVLNPIYYFSPSRRSYLQPLSDSEWEKILNLRHHIDELYGVSISTDNKQLVRSALEKEVYLIESHNDRDLYLDICHEIFGMVSPYVERTVEFRLLREAVTHRNRIIDPSGERLRHALEHIFFPCDKLRQEEAKYHTALLCGDHIELSMLALKYFSTSTHDTGALWDYKFTSILYQLRQYVSESDLESLCPFGYSEWAQFNAFVNFVRETYLDPCGESTEVIAMFNIALLRRAGLNFKQITYQFVKDNLDLHQQLAVQYPERYEGIPTTLEELKKAINDFFASVVDDFLT